MMSTILKDLKMGSASCDLIKYKAEIFPSAYTYLYQKQSYNEIAVIP